MGQKKHNKVEFRLKSFAKINLSLNVLKKKKNGFHIIEGIISFIQLHDLILIKKHNKGQHEVSFYGKFSNGIPKKNSIVSLLNLLEKKQKLYGNKFEIKIYKNIPTKSGLGGGSMNAASILKFLLKKNIIKLNSKEIKDITSKVGSDVILGMQNKSGIIYKDGSIIRTNKKFKLFPVLIKPSWGCSTKKIYKSVNEFSKSQFSNKKKINLNANFFAKLKNDLEKPAFKKYPALKNIKKFMEKIKNISFVRMTGSGSTLICYFNSKKAAVNGEKILKKKYKNYWCILSKTI